ncbi:diacylglycerol kinase family protein [Paenibacillus sacheonensis]|uniref:Diacylglycerol kinase family protein n=1 Tax=Paenibacillus sacheonensis TaxID=742054 RepID=A0A7X5C4E0_9BACL|nr:diacylglycerol kinase family protein [Paenibacillus sacheonensis]MBM7565653.1 diacylglycerol kinase [Paenibacillus sacheonensis]NBC72289.1 diacylglycerol kinase family protein [Paenibacillus sacheonensis]
MRRFLRSVAFAWNGVRSASAAQANMRIHLAAVIIVNTAGLLFGLSRMEWLAVVIVQGMVLAAELLNTAVEHLVDLASPQQHPLAKAAKDTAAGAVLLAAVTSVVVGLIVFVPHIIPNS